MYGPRCRRGGYLKSVAAGKGLTRSVGVKKGGALPSMRRVGPTCPRAVWRPRLSLGSRACFATQDRAKHRRGEVVAVGSGVIGAPDATGEAGYRSEALPHRAQGRFRRAWHLRASARGWRSFEGTHQRRPDGHAFPPSDGTCPPLSPVSGDRGGAGRPPTREAGVKPPT